MQLLFQQRCFNHASREAAARCPDCGRCFCRECVTEHQARVVCAACLRKLTSPGAARRALLTTARQAAQGLAGLALAWLFLYLAGRALLLLPDSFHEGTLWKSAFWPTGAEELRVCATPGRHANPTDPSHAPAGRLP